MTDTTQTLEELEGRKLDDPGYDSYLVTTIYQLHKKPLNQFNVEDLRIMIGQSMHIKYLIPLAIAQLRKNILSQRHFYPGDLLKAVLDSDKRYWLENKDHWRIIVKLVQPYLPIWENDRSFRGFCEVIKNFEAIHA